MKIFGRAKSNFFEDLMIWVEVDDLLISGLSRPLLKFPKEVLESEQDSEATDGGK